MCPLKPNIQTKSIPLELKLKQWFKLVLTISWAATLLLFVSVDSLGDLIRLRGVSFDWNPSPYFLDLFLLDSHITHGNWIIVKTGHFIGFFIMQMLLYFLTGSMWRSIGLSLLLACSSEILQLYFQRDGRLVDMLIDAGGIFLACFLIHHFERLPSEHILKRTIDRLC